eukprot:1395464-Pleurochrysis_carterae.AAC.3
MVRAWQALAPYYSTSAIYCRASQIRAANSRSDYGCAPTTSGAHDYTVWRKANSPLEQVRSRCHA